MFEIDTTWTDTEAAANGWLKVGSTSWADTMRNVTFNQFFAASGASNGINIDGIENVTVRSCPCNLFTATDFGEPLGKKKKLGSTLPVKFRLFFDGTEVTSQEQLDTILTEGGCEAGCPEIQVFDVTGEVAVNLPEDPDDNVGKGGDLGICFRFSDGNWIYNVSLDPAVGFQAGGDYLVQVALPDGCVLEPGNAVFQVK